MASTCIHDNRKVCASSPNGCSRRTFIDQCDMYEYNCDYNTRYQETYMLHCMTSNLEAGISSIPKLQETKDIEDNLINPVSQTASNECVSKSSTFTKTIALSTNSTSPSFKPCICGTTDTITSTTTTSSSSSEMSTHSTTARTTASSSTDNLSTISTILSSTRPNTISTTATSKALNLVPSLYLTSENEIKMETLLTLTTKIQRAMSTSKPEIVYSKNVGFTGCCERPQTWDTTSEDKKSVIIYPEEDNLVLDQNISSDKNIYTTKLLSPLTPTKKVPTIIISTDMITSSFLPNTFDKVEELLIPNTTEIKNSTQTILQTIDKEPRDRTETCESTKDSKHIYPENDVKDTSKISTTYKKTSHVPMFKPIEKSTLPSSTTTNKKTNKCIRCERPKTWKTTQRNSIMILSYPTKTINTIKTIKDITTEKELSYIFIPSKIKSKHTGSATGKTIKLTVTSNIIRTSKMKTPKTTAATEIYRVPPPDITYYDDSNYNPDKYVTLIKINDSVVTKNKLESQSTQYQTWWYPQPCNSKNCERPSTWLTTKFRHWPRKL